MYAIFKEHPQPSVEVEHPGALTPERAISKEYESVDSTLNKE